MRLTVNIILYIVCFFSFRICLAQDASKVYETASLSTGLITDNAGVGSGFFINKNIFITNNHVAENIDETTAEIRTKNNIYTIKKIIAKSKNVDLAIIEINEKVSNYFKLAVPDSVQVGQKVFALGNPTTKDRKIFKNTFTEGTINNILTDRIEIGNKQLLSKVILHSANLNPGNSGGPLLNENCEITGINAYIRQNIDNMNFAIHVEELVSLLNSNGISYEIRNTKVNETPGVVHNSSNNIANSSKNPSVSEHNPVNDSLAIPVVSTSGSSNTGFIIIISLCVISFLFIVFIYAKNNRTKESHITHINLIPGLKKKPDITIENISNAYLIYNDNRFVIAKEQITAGRDDSNDIIIREKFASRVHFKINFLNKKYFLTDLSSKNGTVVNGVNIKSKILEDGDVISVGSAKLFFKTA